MKIVILDKKSMGDDTPFGLLNELGDVIMYDATAPEEIYAHISDADVAVLNKVKITNSVFESCKKLKLICVFATGYDNIDIVSARNHNVAICNVPGYSTDSVALFTVATVLSLITHLNVYDRFVRSGKYSSSIAPNKITPVFHEIRGKRWGIIGGGNIGKAVLKIAEAFGADVVVNKKNATDEFNCVDIDTLCKTSDIITVHCPLNDETRGLINQERISLMKNNIILVNEARGAVLCEAEVADAVLNGKIAAFGCDVYSAEPMPSNHPYHRIKDLENVILTPHAAWAAYEARERCMMIIKNNIDSFFNGDNLNRIV